MLTLDPRSAVAANNVAWSYAEKGENLDTTLQLAQTAVAQEPESHVMNDTLGWVYYKKNLPDLAIRPLELSVRKAPKNAVYHYHLGLAYAKAGKTADARKSLSTALDVASDFAGSEEARKLLATLGT